jgi:hypothetical protein
LKGRNGTEDTANAAGDRAAAVLMYEILDEGLAHPAAASSLGEMF